MSRATGCRQLALAVLVALFAWQAPSGAYEPDPVSDRLVDIADATEVLNREVNAGMARVLADWRGPRDDKHLVYALWDELAGLYWVHHHERYALRSPEVQRLPTPRYGSIYRGLPIWATRVVFIAGACPTLKLNGVLVGTDKLGHFFSQGRKYYTRWLKSRDVARAADQSAFTERAIFGSMTTGVYSNGDLVSNYEGYRYFRGLFEDEVVPGKPAMLRWEDGRYVQAVPFDWRDYVTPWWDEGIAISRYDALLYPHVRERMRAHCDDYAKAPERYAVPPDVDAAMRERYAHLQLKDTQELRLDNLCRDGGAGGISIGKE